jgi:excisionase family DNA binding protein
MTRKGSSEEDLITISEAAEIRGASVSAISHLVRRGRLRSVERFGKTLVYRSDVQAFEPEKPGPKTEKKGLKK